MAVWKAMSELEMGLCYVRTESVFFGMSSECFDEYVLLDNT